MSELGFHVTMRLSDDRVIASSAAERRALARVVYAQGEPRRLLAFRAADNHLHTLLACSRVEAGLYARYAAGSLHKQLGLPVPFEAARIRPIQDQRHLYNAFRYVHRQEAHHGTELDRAHDASSLPDLLGLRLLGQSTNALVRALLPRLGQHELLEQLGVLVPEGEVALRGLADAAAAALALPDLAGRGREVGAARRAMVHLCESTPTAAVAKELGITPFAVRRLRTEPVEPRLLRAVRLQLRLRAALAEPPAAAAPTYGAVI